MARSSSIDVPGSAMADAVVHDGEKRDAQFEKNSGSDEKGQYVINTDDESSSVKIVADHTHRRLRPRHIQLIGIGGTIGTALYVNIGKGLIHGGPANLFMAFTIWCSFIAATTMGMSSRTLHNCGVIADLHQRCG